MNCSLFDNTPAMVKYPDITADISHGDMPGDKISITPDHIHKAKKIFPFLLHNMKQQTTEKITVCICGGSGVGKSEIASILSFWLNQNGIASYTMSGDNYPHRIPMYNDAERLRVFRESAIRGMISEGSYNSEYHGIISALQKEGLDADPSNARNYPWFDRYFENGAKGLRGYLGTENEIDFSEVDDILKKFKSGQQKIWLRRLGRDAASLWYDELDFSEINVLILEWTHGNSDFLQNIDIPVLLNSTPSETLAHRRARNRDGAPDSPFTTLVLSIEQELLIEQAHKAKIILAKTGEILNHREYLELMQCNT